MTGSCPRSVPLGAPVRHEALLERLQRRSRFPLSVVWSLTSRCNLACGHCSVPRRGPDGELGLDEVVRLLDELASLGVLMLSFTGGEPTLRQDLPAIVAAAKARRFSVRLKTNAVLLEGSLADALSDAGLASVTASLYSPNPAEHDSFVGLDGAWERTWRALGDLKRRGLRVSVGYVVMHWNASAVPAFLDLCEAEGFEYVVDPQVAPREDGDLAPLAFCADRRQIAAVFSDSRLLDRSRLSGASGRPASAKLCAAAESVAHISHDGELWPCPNLVRPMGSLKERSFRELWLGSEERRRITALRWADLEECGACGLSGLCPRCAGTALLETGDLRSRSKTACAVAEAFAALGGG